MMHYIIVTDVNSRQYVFQIPEDGFEIISTNESFIVSREEPNLPKFLELISNGHNFIIDNKTVFIPRNLVNIEYKTISEDSY